MSHAPRRIGMLLCAGLIVPIASGITPGCVCGANDAPVPAAATSARRLAPFHAPSARTVRLPEDWHPAGLARDAAAPP